MTTNDERTTEDTSICADCKMPISFVASVRGGWWQHDTYSPRHPASPTTRKRPPAPSVDTVTVEREGELAHQMLDRVIAARATWEAVTRISDDTAYLAYRRALDDMHAAIRIAAARKERT
jgi:hypothetical protein